jgi:hypothetical protein
VSKKEDNTRLAIQEIWIQRRHCSLYVLPCFQCGIGRSMNLSVKVIVPLCAALPPTARGQVSESSPNQRLFVHCFVLLG